MQNAVDHGAHGKDKFVEVAVHTTSGSYPETGYDRHNANQPLRQVLKKAEDQFKITDTTGWVASNSNCRSR